MAGSRATCRDCETRGNRFSRKRRSLSAVSERNKAFGCPIPASFAGVGIFAGGAITLTLQKLIDETPNFTPGAHPCRPSSGQQGGSGSQGAAGLTEVRPCYKAGCPIPASVAGVGTCHPERFTTEFTEGHGAEKAGRPTQSFVWIEWDYGVWIPRLVIFPQSSEIELSKSLSHSSTHRVCPTHSKGWSVWGPAVATDMMVSWTLVNWSLPFPLWNSPHIPVANSLGRQYSVS